MYEGSGGSDVNVPPLPSRRSATNRQRTGTPPLPARRQTFAQFPPPRSAPASVGSEPVPASSSSSSSRLSLVHLDRRVESSRSRAFNDYRDLPTTAAVRPGDAQLVSRSSPSDDDQTPPAPPPRDVELPTSRKKHDHQATTKKENGTPKATECRESIICQRCGRCRCEECARRPSTGRRVVEICSCVSCVRALRRRRQLRRGGYYYDDDDDEATSADVCSCGPCRSDCRRRWALLVALSVCVPCLCLYWPLRCAAGRQVRGCRCVGERCSWRPTGSATESVVVDRVTST